MISYEVSLGFILVSICFLSGSFNLREIIEYQTNMWNVFTFFPLFVVFFISVLAETNRHPFDLPEAEAELVSGYNVEYSAMGFALFSLGEYSNMLNMSKTNIIQKFDKINSTLDHNDLLINTYSMNDPNYKPHAGNPNMSCSKKVHFSNEIDDSINSKDIGVARFEQDQNAMAKLWQQQDILQQRTLTRNTAVPNKNAFEHQFSYLDGNYNRVEDPRLLGQSSRLDNRSTFNR
jgi:hypothetical protein